MGHAVNVPNPLPTTPARRLTAPFRRFLHVESSTGLVLLACTAVALFLANSRWADTVAAFWSTPISITLGPIDLTYPLWYWINDGLMALFFFVIGLEIKRELVSGELSDRRAIVLPLFAAIGGAAVPALIFLAINGIDANAKAWAVPTATDIAFVVGCLALLGSRVPACLKVFLLSLAIFDDLLAVIIIAAFYSGSIGTGWLIAACVAIALITVLQRIGIRSVGVYTLVGVATWFFTLKSGVHPTIAGVALGLLTPARKWLTTGHLRRCAVSVRRAIDEGSPEAQNVALANLRTAARENISPAVRLETALHPWVAFAVMPLFALANAGVPVTGDMLGNTLALAIALGLIVGKLIGITAGAWLAVRSGLGVLPAGMTWPAVMASASLAGIGFTMSMFIGSLALEGEALTAAKTGVLLGSLVSGLIGFIGLRLVLKKPADDMPAGPALDAAVSEGALASASQSSSRDREASSVS
ncbi:MAG: Na+/H+ antiporter NhaA [Planctomycetota bacterium]|nr:Na+/H+ antiporter NhaA [Planctomycetota bacterium]